jgi:serine protease Do
MPDFAAVVEAVKPAVLSVRVRSRAAPQAMGNSRSDVPFAPFLRGPQDPRGGGQRMPGEQARQRPLIESVGSAFFISPDGYAVTGHHVVANAAKVELVTETGETFKAKIIGSDARTDVALLKVDGRSDFTYVGFTTVAPRIGDWVVAMGNPFGLGGSVTAGIISGEGRNIGLGPYDEYLQIDAAVNKGNSGGPAFNLDGQVVGVNSAIISSSPTGGSIGIAFAIPAATVQKVATQLKDKGRVERGWLGVEIQTMTAEIADGLGLKDPKGALVADVEADGPAAAAGLQPGDIITHLNQSEIKDSQQMTRQIADLAPRDDVMLVVVRDGKSMTVRAALGSFSDEEQAAGEGDGPSSDAGIDGAPVDLGLILEPAPAVGAGLRGLAVTDIAPNGRALEFGIIVGDILLQAGGKELSKPDEFARVIAEAKAAGHRHALLLVRRNDHQRFVAIPVSAG